MSRFIVALFFAFALVLGYSTSTSAQNLNCTNFQFQEDAQEVYDADPSDPNGLDGPIGPTSSGAPGVACENLPSRGGGGGIAAPAAAAPAAEASVADTSGGGGGGNAASAGAVASVPSTGTGPAGIDMNGPALVLLTLAGAFGLAALRARKAA